MHFTNREQGNGLASTSPCEKMYQGDIVVFIWLEIPTESIEVTVLRQPSQTPYVCLTSKTFWGLAVGQTTGSGRRIRVILWMFWRGRIWNSGRIQLAKKTKLKKENNGLFSILFSSVRRNSCHGYEAAQTWRRQRDRQQASSLRPWSPRKNIAWNNAARTLQAGRQLLRRARARYRGLIPKHWKSTIPPTSHRGE